MFGAKIKVPFTPLKGVGKREAQNICQISVFMKRCLSLRIRKKGREREKREGGVMRVKERGLKISLAKSAVV